MNEATIETTTDIAQNVMIEGIARRNAQKDGLTVLKAKRLAVWDTGANTQVNTPHFDAADGAENQRSNPDDILQPVVRYHSWTSLTPGIITRNMQPPIHTDYTEVPLPWLYRFLGIPARVPITVRLPLVGEEGEATDFIARTFVPIVPAIWTQGYRWVPNMRFGQTLIFDVGKSFHYALPAEPTEAAAERTRLSVTGVVAVVNAEQWDYISQTWSRDPNDWDWRAVPLSRSSPETDQVGVTQGKTKQEL